MKVLILCPSEICYNPRLLKAADYFYSMGDEVIVYNAVTGLADDKIYRSVKKGRSWEIIENDITKRGFSARLRWLYSSAVNKLAEELFKRNISLRVLFPHVMTKGYVLFPGSLKRVQFDYILIHLVDSLPFAVKLKRLTGAKLIYDCQEYFKGQYETESAFRRKWVHEAEGKYVAEANIVLATTNIMMQRLKQEFSGPGLFFRVRNTPAKKFLRNEGKIGTSLKMIWHGMSIIPKNIRGIHIILEAVSRCKTPVELFLQGNITDQNRTRLTYMLKELGIENKVHVLAPADPDEIVESLTGYDLGVLGELSAQDNQRLTSSNKLFEYIYAGLAVLAPDLPGLSETISEYGVGLLYKQGDSKDLAERIDALNLDHVSLQKYKEVSWKAGQAELFWENDYKKVWEAMGNLADSGGAHANG
jgi:glycosyltransferase involved in cell wall biosynthesis